MSASRLERQAFSVSALAIMVGTSAFVPRAANAQLELDEFHFNYQAVLQPIGGSWYLISGAVMNSRDAGWHQQYFTDLSVRITQPQYQDANTASI